MRLSVAVVAFVLIASVACGDGTRTPEPRATQDAERGGSIDLSDVETVVGDLEVPWAIAFVDEDTLLVTERSGRVRVVEDGRLRDGPAASIDVNAQSEAGLLGIALHPDFPEERSAYLYYTAADENRVVRFSVGDDLTFSDEEVIVDEIPAGPNHDGGRIAFGPDGMLYIGTGDAGNGDDAADRGSLAGKILRVGPDGSVPDDNPFDGSPVYSYGHRNVQGLAWDDEGRLYASEHGPTGEDGQCCHDEINVVEAGGFYGWPFHAGAAEAPDGDAPAEALDPAAESGARETWAPAGVAYVRSDDDASLFVATLAGARLLRFPFEEAPDVGDPETALEGHGRMREAIVGPDDCLYMTTSNKDGRGSPSGEDDRILRVCPS